MLFSEFCKECTDKRILTRLLPLRWLPHMSIGKGYRAIGTIELRPLERHREDGREGKMPRRNLGKRWLDRETQRTAGTSGIEKGQGKTWVYGEKRMTGEIKR